MPLYTYHCESCLKETRKLISLKERTETIECECGQQAKYQLPTIGDTTIYEARDKHRNKQLPKGHDQRMRKRMNDHHDRYEIEEKVDKYGLDDAKKFGWDKKIKRV